MSNSALAGDSVMGSHVRDHAGYVERVDRCRDDTVDIAC